jgi:hypothetical protein
VLVSEYRRRPAATDADALSGKGDARRDHPFPLCVDRALPRRVDLGGALA